jgi:hypothetical protein
VPDTGQAPVVTLTVTVDAAAVCRFAAAVGPGPVGPLGGEFHATAGRWVGATVGLFATAPASAPATAATAPGDVGATPPARFAEFDRFDVRTAPE